MSSNVTYDAVRTYVSARWTETLVQWENERFTPPDAPWVAVEMSGTFYGQQTIGAANAADNRWDEEGVLWLHVFVPIHTGSSTARRIAKQLADLFRGTTLLSGSLEFMTAEIGLGEPGDDKGRTWRLSVAIDWRRYDS